MTDQHVRDLLEEAAADVPAPDLARTALAGARRRRRGRVAAVAVASAAAVVAGVAVSLGDAARQEPPAVDRTSSATPTPDDADPVYPDLLTAGMVHDRWKPERLASLDWHRGSFPRSVTGSAAGLAELSAEPLAAAVAVYQSGGSPTDLVVVGVDGEQRVVRIEGASALTSDYAEPVGLGRGASLSWDGTRLAVLQGDAVVVVDVTTGSERRYPVGENLWDRAGAESSWHLRGSEWSPDGSELLLLERLSLDLDDGSLTMLPLRSGEETSTYAPDGSILEYHSKDIHNRELRRWVDSELVGRHAPLSYLGVLHSMAAGETGIAGLREVISWGVPRADYMNSGVVVLSHTGDGRALLPMPDDADRSTGSSYGYLLGTDVLGWVDAERVLISFGGLGEAHALVTWNIETGELQRISDLAAGVELHVAAGLLD